MDQNHAEKRDENHDSTTTDTRFEGKILQTWRPPILNSNIIEPKIEREIEIEIDEILLSSFDHQSRNI